MTNEQATKIRSCFANGVEFKEQIGISDEYQSLAEVMDKAIKKQIKQKVIGNLHSVPQYRCPNCNLAIKMFMKDPAHPYCCWCGQALDWSDEDDTK